MDNKNITKEKEAGFVPNKEKPCSVPCTCKILHSFDGEKLIAKSIRILQSVPLTPKEKENLAKKSSIIICKIDADETGKKASIQCLQHDVPNPESKQLLKQIDCKPKTDCKPQQRSENQRRESIVDCKPKSERCNQKGESIDQTKQSILSLATVHKIDLNPCKFEKCAPQSFLNISVVPRQNVPVPQPRYSHQKTLSHQPDKSSCRQHSQSCNQVSRNTFRNICIQQQNFCNQVLNMQHQRACHQNRQFLSHASPTEYCNQQFNKVATNHHQSCGSYPQFGKHILNELSQKRYLQQQKVYVHNQQCNHLLIDPCKSKYIEQQNPCNQNQLFNRVPNGEHKEMLPKQQQTSNEFLGTNWIHNNKYKQQQNQYNQALIDENQELRYQLQQLCNRFSNGIHQNGNIQSHNHWANPLIYSSKKEVPNNTPQNCENEEHQLLHQQLMHALLKLRQFHYQKQIVNTSGYCCKHQNYSNKQQSSSHQAPINQCFCNQSLAKNLNDESRDCCQHQCESLTQNLINTPQHCSCNEQNQPAINISIDPQSNCGHQQGQSIVSGQLPHNSLQNFMTTAMNNPNMALAIFKRISQDIQNNTNNAEICPPDQKPVNAQKSKTSGDFSKIASTSSNNGKQIINKENCFEEKSSQENLLAGYCTDEYVDFESNWITSEVNEPQIVTKKSSHYPKDKTPVYKTNINTEFLEKDVRKTVKCSTAHSCFEKGFPYRRYLLEAKGLIPSSTGDINEVEQNDKEQTPPIESAT